MLGPNQNASNDSNSEKEDFSTQVFWDFSIMYPSFSSVLAALLTPKKAISWFYRTERMSLF